jgi:uncharacterized protein
MKGFLAFLTFLFALAIAPRVLAFVPPPMTAHVTDTAHKLTEQERLDIDKKLEDYRLRTTNEIAVFIPASLDGETIEDVGIATGRAWKLGVKGKDNGVLLIIAPVERKARIEVGRGVEGALTDLQANDIIRQKIRPNLAPGRENYRAAVDQATDAIISDLDKGGAAGGPVTRPAAKPTTPADALFAIVFMLIILGVPIIFMIVIIKAIAGAFSSNGRSANRGWASGSSWSNDSWSSGGGSDSGWSGGGGGDSGFSGGGGDFGGGGSSDSF